MVRMTKGMIASLIWTLSCAGKVKVSATAPTNAALRTEFQIPTSTPTLTAAANETSSSAAVSGTNHPPVFSQLNDRVIKDGSLLSFQLTATDADNDSLQFTCTQGCPSGMNVTSGGDVTWTASTVDIGTMTLVFSVNDSNGGSTSESMSLTVSPRFSSGMSAFRVIGQSNFTSCLANRGEASTNRGGFNNVEGISVDTQGRFFAVDYLNHRLLTWSQLPTSNGALPDLVWGQPDFTTSANGGGNQSLSYPRVGFDTGSDFILVDGLNSRILGFATAPSGPSATPTFVLGQTDFNGVTSNQCACTTPGANTLGSQQGMHAFAVSQKLVVTDRANSRVLIFNRPLSTNMNASLVLGAANMATDLSTPPSASSSSFNVPAAAWSNGTLLLVADRGNNRVLGWRTFPTQDNQPADFVLGQASFTVKNANRGGSVAANTMNQPYSVTSDGTRIFVGDKGNNRILIFNSIPSPSSPDGPDADIVLGQQLMTTNTSGCTASTMQTATGLWWDGSNLLATDSGNNRVLFFGDAE